MTRYEILTPSGWSAFDGVRKTVARTIRLDFDNGRHLTCTPDHLLMITDGSFVEASNTLGKMLEGDVTVVSIGDSGVSPVYDALEVEKGHQYLTNGVVSHNCRFLSSDEQLFDSMFLSWLTDELKNVPVVSSKNNIAVFEPIQESGAVYVVGIDPSKGVDRDYSAIQVWRVTEEAKFVQTAEYRSNDIKTPQFYSLIKKLLKTLDNDMKNQVYFGIENNGVGEGLMALYSNDPDILSLGAAHMIHEKVGTMGLTTTPKSKIRACLILKELVESKALVINSHAMLREMKMYVRHKGSFAAQYGGTDDLISAALLCARLVKDHVSNYDMNAFNAIHVYDDTGTEHDLMFRPSFL